MIFFNLIIKFQLLRKYRCHRYEYQLFENKNKYITKNIGYTDSYNTSQKCINIYIHNILCM